MCVLPLAIQLVLAPACVFSDTSLLRHPCLPWPLSIDDVCPLTIRTASPCQLRLIEIFRTLDNDRSGKITRQEFSDGIRVRLRARALIG